VNRSFEPAKPRISAPSQFVTTQWQVVLQAGRNGEAQRWALEELCGSYWYPLYAYVRRRGNDPDDAADLTQEFFARVLRKNWLSDLTPGAGRFRCFLLTAMNRFLANEYDRSQAVKRGGDRQFISLDQRMAEARYFSEPVALETPEKTFDRRWALTVLEQALSRLRSEVLDTGNTRQFELLVPFLSREPETGEYAGLAARLEITRGAVGTAVYRLRLRYRQLVRDEIAGTVTNSSQVEEEMQDLFAALRS
jgi:DNA-directed RNA polymerase specialized sigma24 family protein